MLFSQTLMQHFSKIDFKHAYLQLRTDEACKRNGTVTIEWPLESHLRQLFDRVRSNTFYRVVQGLKVF